MRGVWGPGQEEKIKILIDELAIVHGPVKQFEGDLIEKGL